MKKILCLALMLMPLTFVKASEGFETKSGIVLEQEIYDFIKEFGYSDEMIYEMSEDDLNIFVGADLDTVEMTKQTFYLPPEELPHGGVSTLDLSTTTAYKTLTGAKFYNSSVGKYQLYTTAEFLTIPSSSRRFDDYMFISWDGVNSSNHTLSGYIVTTEQVYGLSEFTYSGMNDLSGKIISHYGYYAKGAAFQLPATSQYEGTMTNAVWGLSVQLSSMPSRAYTVVYEQYDRSSAILSKLAISRIDLYSITDYRFNDDITESSGMTEYTMMLVERES